MVKWKETLESKEEARAGSWCHELCPCRSRCCQTNTCKYDSGGNTCPDYLSRGPPQYFDKHRHASKFQPTTGGGVEGGGVGGGGGGSGEEVGGGGGGSGVEEEVGWR